MNWLTIFKLINEIFTRRVPDIKKIEDMGLLAIKVGQVFALRIDLLNETKCHALSKLYGSVSSVPEESVKPLINAYVGPCFWEDIQSFDERSFASASVGQVHKAVLMNGDQVAIKVIKKNYEESFKKDVKAFLSLVKWAIRFYPKLDRVADPIGVLKTIRTNTLDELDLTNELKNQHILKGIYNEYQNVFDLKKLRFLKYYDQMSSEHILVSEYISGPTFEALLNKGELPYEKLLDLFHLHGFFIFGVGTFHGDIHPGNILLDKDERICFVDYGALGHVGERMRKGLFRFMSALSYYDFNQCAHRLNEMSEVTLRGDKYTIYAQKFMALYADFKGKTVKDVSLTKKMMDTIKLGVHSGMRFEKGMFGIIKSLMYLDGMVLRCKPDAILMEDMRDFIKELEPYVEQM